MNLKKKRKSSLNTIDITNPELKNIWLETKNGSMSNYTRGYSKKVYWECKKIFQCNKPHIWQALIGNIITMRQRARVAIPLKPPIT